MKLRILWLGKTRNSNLASVCKDFASRSGHFVGTEITELREPRVKAERKRVELEGGTTAIGHRPLSLRRGPGPTRTFLHLGRIRRLS